MFMLSTHHSLLGSLEAYSANCVPTALDPLPDHDPRYPWTHLHRTERQLRHENNHFMAIIQVNL